MEVDSPTSSSSPVQNGGTLKRSNSAPMINTLVTSQADISPPATLKPITCAALRRLSSSNMSLHSTPASTSPPIRGTDRVARIKQEEIHIADRERQHEREIQSSLWISSNWEHISLDMSEPMEGQQRRPRSFSESLHIMTQTNILCGSPSPTRAATKQCFSPSMQIPVKNTTFTPSPSPSPTRKTFLRSLSPIAVRTGAYKRKLESDGDRWEYISPPKKFNTGPSTPDRIMTCSHPLANSISSSSLEESSPEQTVPRTHSCSGISSTTHKHRAAHHLAAFGAHSSLSVINRGHSPHTSISSQRVAIVPTLMVSKQAFLFRPVQQTGGSPSSSSSLLSSTISLHHLEEHQQQHLEQSSLECGLALHHTQPDHTDMVSESGNHISSDIYMSDSEMRDHSNIVDKSADFNFKPISPDHA
ncbi:hypothetical protein BsWGS_03235 [Bradybaena similaris]